MRARSAKQRFPVAQWKEDLAVIHDTAIKMSQKQVIKTGRHSTQGTGTITPNSGFGTPNQIWSSRRSISNYLGIGGNSSEQTTRAPSPSGEGDVPLSMGSRTGPGHISERKARGRKRLRKLAPDSRDSSVRSRSARRSIFKSGASSRANSTDRSTVKGKQPITKSALSGPMPSSSAARDQAPDSRVSRISEHTDEDKHEPANASQGDLRQFNFSNNNNYDDNVSRQSVCEESDMEASVDPSVVDEYLLTPEQVENEREKLRVANLRRTLEAHAGGSASEGSTLPPFAPSASLVGGSTPSLPGTPLAADGLMPVSGTGTPRDSITVPTDSYLSLDRVLQGKKDYKLQNVEPSFNDPTGLYYQSFEHKLRKLNGKNSESSLCIEEYLTRSERDWFNRYRNVKLGKSPASSQASSIFRVERQRPDEPAVSDVRISDARSDEGAEQFLLQEDYAPPTGIRKLLLRRIGQWPLYTFLLAFVSIRVSNRHNR